MSIRRDGRFYNRHHGHWINIVRKNINFLLLLNIHLLIILIKIKVIQITISTSRASACKGAISALIPELEHEFASFVKGVVIILNLSLLD